MQKRIQTALENTKAASQKLIQLKDEEIKQMLNALADLTVAEIPFLLTENK